jgi:UDP:flavonoid glycosyltransferase YjiC (YdhE family)
MAAAAHHAGAGTVGATLRAGIPCITIPETFDHPFWSRHIADQGLGPPPILPKQVSLATFGQAISAAAHPTMRARAAAFGERVRAENGVATAVAHLNRYFGAARVEL